MNEKDDKLNKGSFLYINDEKKAQWGFPEGYPYKQGGKTVIKWDGNESGLTKVVFFENNSAFKVSDLTPSVTEIFKNGGMVSIEISDSSKFDISENELTVSEDIVFGSWFFVVYKAGATLYSTYVFPEPGVYFSKQYSGNDSADNYPTSMTYGSETIHQMAPEFLPSATTTTLGTVKQMSYLPNATGNAPTAENFNQLVRELKNAGLMK